MLAELRKAWPDHWDDYIAPGAGIVDGLLYGLMVEADYLKNSRRPPVWVDGRSRLP